MKVTPYDSRHVKAGETIDIGGAYYVALVDGAMYEQDFRPLWPHERVWLALSNFGCFVRYQWFKLYDKVF